jgi:hypothetical protein
MLTTTSILLYNLNDKSENTAVTNAIPVENPIVIENGQTAATDNIVVEETTEASNSSSAENYASSSVETKNNAKTKASKKSTANIVKQSTTSNLASKNLSASNTPKATAKASNGDETAVETIINNCFMIDKSCLSPIDIQFVAFDGFNSSNNMLSLHPQHFKSVGSDGMIGKNELHAQGLNLYQGNDFLINGSMALAYFRNWNGRISVGLEGAYENINKVVFNENTQQFDSPELANAASISALVRYDELALSMFNIHPFVQCQVGLGLNANYVYGGCVGLKYSPMYSRFGLQASYNYKAFQYYYGGTSANSEVFEKNGLAVSLIYRF